MKINDWKNMNIEDIIKDLTQTSDDKPASQIGVAQAFIQAKLNKALIDGQKKLVWATWALVVVTAILTLKK